MYVGFHWKNSGKMELPRIYTRSRAEAKAGVGGTAHYFAISLGVNLAFIARIPLTHRG